MNYSFEMLEKCHQRAFFACGEGALDRYLKEQASQDVKRYYASVVVAVETGKSEVLGYYTLSASSVPLNLLPVAAQRKLPRYDAIPSVLLGRLAVTAMMQGQGLGESLLGNAVELACKYSMAWAMFLVSAKNDTAAQFYTRYGFNALESDPLLLWAPRQAVAKLS